MSALLWKLNRLRAMGVPEIACRLRDATQAQWERRGLGLARPVSPEGVCGRPWLGDLPREFDSNAYRTAADGVLAGRFDVFALKDVSLGFPPQWNRDPKTGRVAPLAFGKTLNYRDERVVGDIKYLWEPNRHSELVALAQAWHLTKEANYLEGCRVLLDSWIEQCPYPLGVNWTSSLEHGVRLANWAVAWFLFGVDGRLRVGLDSDLRRNDAFAKRWLIAIYQHCHFIAGHLSRHSSANNHLLGELMGLFIGATVWPLWPDSTRWREQAACEFEAEALKQTAEDGVNREQAIWYQHEVADMMLLVGLFGLANGTEFSAAYWRRLERMLEFFAALMDAGGHVPMIGDADDARLVRFTPAGGKELSSAVRGNCGSEVYRSLLATGAVLFGRGDFKAKAGGFDDKSRWLLGDAAARTFDELPVPEQEEPRRDFPHGGYAILGGRFGTPREVRIVVDAGPLGYLSIAAHGHADALAFTLSAGGREILIDPGTYAFHTQRMWRDYFKGTGAHNAVRVDGADQSVSGGNFLWTQHARAGRDRFEHDGTRSVWSGTHDGYLRLPDPVGHRRTIACDVAAGSLRVTDRLECKGRHEVEVLFHLSEHCRVQDVDGTIHVEDGPVRVSLRNTAPGWLPRIVRGQENPPLGWVSRRLDEKSPCASVVWAGVVVGTAELVTEISVVFR